MDLIALTKKIDAKTARAFAKAARHVIDAMLVEAECIRKTQTPRPRDYRQAGLSRASAAGGWLSHVELRETSARLAEAIAGEEWLDGLLIAVRALAIAGGGL